MRILRISLLFGLRRYSYLRRKGNKVKDSIRINDKKRAMSIFKSLMSVRLYGNTAKTQQHLLKELQEREKKREFRIYYPERNQS